MADTPKLKTVHVVIFGCNLTSEPLPEALAEELCARIERMDMAVFVRECGRPLEDDANG